jgi:hypothetical protein
MALKSFIRYIQRVLRVYIRLRQFALDVPDVARINGASERLNREAADALEYQSRDIYS